MTAQRLPLAGVYNTRPGTVTTPGTSSIAGIAIAGIAIAGKSNSGSDKDHRLINCFQLTEQDQITNSQKLYVQKRPGLASFSTPQAGSIGNDIHVWAGQGTGQKVMSCFGGTNSTLYDGTTSKGTITGKATAITETLSSGTPMLVIPSTDSTGWTYVDGAAVSKIADVNFPGNATRTLAGSFAHMDGYAFIMDDKCRVYNSALNDPRTWSATGFLTASSIPDIGVGCVRLRSLIVAFCKKHFEVYQNLGEPAGSPLSVIKSMTRLIGCLSADAITSIRDTIYFGGSTDNANIAIYSYSGGDPQKISTPEIENQLIIAGPSNVTLTTLGMFGRHFVIVLASSNTYCYCVEENKWSEMTGLQLWHKAAGVAIGSVMLNYTISKTSTGGKVYIVNPASIAWRDDGSVYTMTVQSGKWDAGSARRKFCDDLDIIGDQQTSTSNLSVQWSDDDYQTLSTARTVDLSKARPRLTRCGSFGRRSFTLTHSDNTNCRLEAIEADVRMALA